MILELMPSRAETYHVFLKTIACYTCELAHPHHCQHEIVQDFIGLAMAVPTTPASLALIISIKIHRYRMSKNELSVEKTWKMQ